MRWEDLQPGDQLLPLFGARSRALLGCDSDSDPMIVLKVDVLKNDGRDVNPFGQSDVVHILFMNARTAETFKEVRYTSGSAALGYEIVRGGERIG